MGIERSGAMRINPSILFPILLNLYLTRLVPLRSISCTRNTWSRQVWAEEQYQDFIGNNLGEKKQKGELEREGIAMSF